MKGILLAGGSAKRLQPVTNVISKQLLPIYDKPMIYYPLSTLMLAGIRDILIISTPRDLPLLKALFGDGKNIGLNLSYKVQEKPNGIAEAFILSKDFIGDDRVCLILGDNIFYGQTLRKLLQQAVKSKKSTVFGYYVNNPSAYGVAKLDENENLIDILEKPQNPPSHYAVVGLYFYNNDVIKIAENIKPSSRGELEITDVNREYLHKNELNLIQMGRGIAWLDTGTPRGLLDAANYVATIQERQGLSISCIEEIAYRMGYITKDELRNLVYDTKTDYGQYLINLFDL